MNRIAANRRLGTCVWAVLLVAATAFNSSGLAFEAPAIQDRSDASQITAADWPTYNHDPAGWRYNPAETILSPPNVHQLAEKWRFPAADSTEVIGVVHATPAVVDGEVYFGTATFPAFYKLARDGHLLWSYRNPARKAVLPPTDGAPITEKLRGAASEAGIFSSALVAAGAVYFADVGGWMYCLDASTGKERWKVDARHADFPGSHWNNLFMASPIWADGRVVFGGGTLEQLFAGTPGYAGSTGRGFLVAVEPQTGKIVWKYDVGPPPKKLNPPVVVKGDWGEYRFQSGPATSSVWCTPTYDAESNLLFVGTDVNTAPRLPTDDNPELSTEDSCAVLCLNAATGERKWNTQLNPGDVWTNAMRAFDSKTGLYKDQAVGDSPKVLVIDVNGKRTKVVGAGCKNGGFYLLDAENGKLIRHTPVYAGPPTHPPSRMQHPRPTREPHNHFEPNSIANPAAEDGREEIGESRKLTDKRPNSIANPANPRPGPLALPSPIGGLQSGCATDGKTIYTNGIDALRLGTQASPTAAGQFPTGGRVTATSADLTDERWRHERPTIAEMGGLPGKPMYRDVGDIVGSGIAVGNGVVYFTTVGSGKLIVLDAANGKILKEITLGPVFAGPALSRGHVYVGSGNTLWSPSDFECFFPKQYTGGVRCFGLPD